MKIYPLLAVLILILLVPSISAEEFEPELIEVKIPQWTPEMQNVVFEEMGINNQYISNCAGCSYDSTSQTLTLRAGASITSEGINEMTRGTSINLNGGKITLDQSGASFSGDGTFRKGNPPELEQGSILYQGLTSTNLKFKNSEVKRESSGTELVTVQGSGNIIEGRLFIEKGEIKNAKGFGKPIGPVENVFLKGVGGGQVDLIATKGFKLGNGDSYIGLDNLGEKFRHFSIKNFNDEMVIEVGVLTDVSGLDYEKGNSPNILIRGKPSILIGDHHKNYGYEPLKIDINGDKHTFLGPLTIEQAEVFIPGRTEIDENQNPRMVDGIYTSSINPISVYFDDKEHSGDYIALGDKLRVGGTGFTIALSEKSERFMANGFLYPFEGNKYAIKNEPGSSPFRLGFSLGLDPPFPGDYDPNKENSLAEVIIDPNSKSIRSSGDLQLTNGPNRFRYYVSKDGIQEYDYAYIGAGAPGFSATELDYDMLDGGKLNVESEKGLPLLENPGRKVKQELIFGGYIEDDFSDDEQEALRAEATEVGMELQEFIDKKSEESRVVEFEDGKVYVASYNGGQWSRDLNDGDFEKSRRTIGHVGIITVIQGSLFTIETNGESTRIIPFDSSLFGASKLHDLYEVRDRNGNPISSTPVRQWAERKAGEKYDYLPWTDALSCAGVTLAGVQAALPTEQKDQFQSARVNLEHLNKDTLSLPNLYAVAFSNVISKIPSLGKEIPTPQSVIQNNPFLSVVSSTPIENLAIESIVSKALEKHKTKNK
jgi:hypothetical protein